MHRAPVRPRTRAAAASQLVLSGVTKRYDDLVVLDRVSFSVRPGERVGVIGDNGSGKSTLLRLIATAAAGGEDGERPDAGTLTVTAPGGTGHLAQTPDLPGTATVGDAIDRALAGIRALERRIHEAGAALGTAGPAELAAYDALLAEFEARGGREADRRVEITLHKLGERGGPDRARPLSTLSGGQRSRLALAATLASAPELLLLDEPTNDLDDEAVAWLEDHLLRHPGTVVAVTHDRAFLDRVTTTVLEVDGDLRTVRRHGDGYAGHLAARAAARARWEYAYEEWRTEITRHIALLEANSGRLSAIPRKGPRGFSGAGAFRARSRAHGAASRVRGARERLDRLTANPVPAPPRPLRFAGRVRGGEPAAVPAVELADVRVAGRLDLPGPLHLAPGERLLVTGPNGAGKSTLLQVLAGELVPDGARLLRTPARVGFLRQDVGGGVPQPGGRTVLAAYAQGRGTGGTDPSGLADELLALGLFRPADLGRPLRSLSTGQRRRLDLARLVGHPEPYDLLLLDEPTNHFAPGLVEEVEEALVHWTGTLVVVSHDRRVRERFGGSRLELAPAAARRGGRGV